MLPCLTFTPRCKSLSGLMVFFAVSFLLFFGAENGLASQQVRALVLKKCVLVGDAWPALTRSDANLIFHYFIGDPPSYMESFPELWGLKVQRGGAPNYIVDYVPYGTYPLNVGGYVKYPYFYRESGIINAGSVPDDFTDDDLANLNSTYNNLPEEQKLALKGSFSYGSQTIDGQNYPVFEFATQPVGSATGTGGVYTYDSSGNVVQSFPDGSGFASGFKQNADGSYSPFYYQLNGDSITETSSIPTPDYSSLTYDTVTGQYSLDVPDYSSQLDTIISRIDNIDLHVPAPNVNVNPTVNVPAPEVTVNVPAPEVTVNVPAPEVTVNPDISVNVSVPDSISSGLSHANNTLSNILDSVEGNASDTSEDFDDLTLTSEEESLVARYVDWETNIPLIGDALDVGLTTLLGRIPNVGTEYLWLDYTIGGGSSSAGASGRRSSSLASASNPLAGYNIRIDLISYRDILLGARGVMILFEALYFCMLTLKCIRQALSV